MRIKAHIEGETLWWSDRMSGGWVHEDRASDMPLQSAQRVITMIHRHNEQLDRDERIEPILVRDRF